MDKVAVANELIKVAKSLTARSGVVVLYKDDFRYPSMWNTILDELNIPRGEAADFREPLELTLRVSKVD